MKKTNSYWLEIVSIERAKMLPEVYRILDDDTEVLVTKEEDLIGELAIKHKI